MSPKKSTIAPTGRASSSRATTITSKPTTAQARTIGKKPHFEAKFKRMDDLKAKYGAVSAALKPALLEIANRTANELQNDTHYHRTGANKDQLEAVETELKKARDRAIAEISAQTTLKMETVQRKTEFDMWQVGQQYEVRHPRSIVSAGANTDLGEA